MRRDTRYEIGDKKKGFLFVLLILLISYLVLPITIFAQDSSPSGSLLQKLNELKNDIASKAAQIKNEINRKVQNRALMGKILSIESNEMTIQTLDDSKTFKFDEFTEIIGLKDKKIDLKTLDVSDNIAALGDMDDKNNLIAKRIVYLDKFASNSAQLVWGQIQKTTGSIITIKTKTEETKNIFVDAQTDFFLGNEEASITDAKVEQHLVVRGIPLKDGSLRARFIYFIPSMGFLKPNKTDSSPSAQPKTNS